MEDQLHDASTELSPIPLGLRESWKGLHGCAQISDEQWWSKASVSSCGGHPSMENGGI